MNRHVAFFGQILLVYPLFSLACFLMLRITFGYTAFEDDVQFLATKQAYVHDPVWKAAFYIHVFTAVLALLAGFMQLARPFSEQNRTAHRWIGTVYVWTILAINVPVGMVLAVNANGLLPARIAFVLLDVLWGYFTYLAYRSAREKNFARHKRFMMRSYALTFSAITLRSWHMLLVHFPLDTLSIYMLEAWLGFVPNLMVAEWLIRTKKAR